MLKKLLLEEDDQPVVEVESKKEEVKEEPTTEEIPAQELNDVSIAGLIHESISSTWKSIDELKSYIVTIQYHEGSQEVIDILNEIVKDKMVHVGMLEKALTLVSPEASLINTGETVGEEIISNQE